MKRLLFCSVLLILSGCIKAADPTSPASGECAETPPGTLEEKDVKKISLNSVTIKESGTIRAGKSIGYTFESQANQRLSYSSKQEICLWIYSPDNTLLNSGDLPKAGQYIIQVSAPKGSTTFDLEMSLGTLSVSAPPTSTFSPPSTSTLTPNQIPVPSTTSSVTSGFSQNDASQLVQNWLSSKGEIFGPPFNRRLVANFTDTRGPLYTDITKDKGSIDWLYNNNSRYVYRQARISQVFEFSTSGSQPFLKVKIFEDRTLYGPNGIDRSNSGENTSSYVYFFSQENGIWKIYDYKDAN